MIHKILVIGVHSFHTKDKRSGIQHIARGLARSGYEVDYLPVPSSPFDLFGSERCKRLKRHLGGVSTGYMSFPVPEIREWGCLSPFPIHSLFVRFKWQIDLIRRTMPMPLSTAQYDLCLHDVGPTMVYIPSVKARYMILRFNDALDGFKEMPRFLTEELKERMSENQYDMVWSVSPTLGKEAQRLVPPEKIHCIPNGLDSNQFESKQHPVRPIRKRCCYLGGNQPWVDVELICATAKILVDWEFHLVGDGFHQHGLPDNIHCLPSVPHENAGNILREYTVGLLPYKNILGRMKAVYRPLKFYEYFAAGLGIASVDVGNLKVGMGTKAEYGNSPKAYAAAIERSVGVAQNITVEERQAFILRNSWDNRITEMMELLNGLCR